MKIAECGVRPPAPPLPTGRQARSGPGPAGRDCGISSLSEGFIIQPTLEPMSP
jgi:hypothetical protein